MTETTAEAPAAGVGGGDKLSRLADKVWAGTASGGGSRGGGADAGGGRRDERQEDAGDGGAKDRGGRAGRPEAEASGGGEAPAGGDGGAPRRADKGRERETDIRGDEGDLSDDDLYRSLLKRFGADDDEDEIDDEPASDGGEGAGDEPGAKRRRSSSSGVEVEDLERHERYFFDKLSGNPAAMARQIAQQEGYIAQLRDDLDKAIRYADSNKPVFDLEAAAGGYEREIEADHPEWDDARIRRAARGWALADKEEFDAKRGGEEEDFRSFQEKQSRREAEEAARLERARAGAQKFFLSETNGNRGLARYALDLAVRRASEGGGANVNAAQVLADAGEEFEAEIVSHLEKAPSFGPRFREAMRKIALQDKELVKSIGLSFLRESLRPHGSKPKSARDMTGAAARGEPQPEDAPPARGRGGRGPRRRTGREAEQDLARRGDEVMRRLGMAV